jgi:hypothetical protein
MRADGKTDPSAVLRALCAAPSEVLGLMRVAADAFFARNALERGRRLLGPSLGLVETAHADPVAAAAATGILSGLEGIPHPLAAEKLA